MRQRPVRARTAALPEFHDDQRPLSSVTSPRVRAARRLLKRGLRERDQAFLAEGPQSVREALTAAVVREMFVTELAIERHHDLIELAAGTGVVVHSVTDEVSEALTDTVNPQGIVAVCELPAEPDAVPAGSSLVMVLASVRDPGNAGTMIRIADAAGADAVVLSPDSVDVHNPKCVRASAGSIFHVPLVRVPDLPAALRHLRADGLQVWAASAGGERLDELAAGRLGRPTAWVFGNEAWGIPQDVLDASDASVAVPILGQAESLNVATAAAVCMYAARLAGGKPARTPGGRPSVPRL